MGQAQLLYRDSSSYALCIYIAGLAVECMLRAFKGKSGLTFDEKHNLKKLFAESGFLNSLEDGALGSGEDVIRQTRREMHRTLALPFCCGQTTFGSPPRNDYDLI